MKVISTKSWRFLAPRKLHSRLSRQAAGGSFQLEALEDYEVRQELPLGIAEEEVRVL